MDELIHLIGIVLVYLVDLSDSVRLSVSKQMRVGTCNALKIIQLGKMCQMKCNIEEN